MNETHEYHEVRAQIASEGARALVIISGGGIVALLGFLSSIWGENNTTLVRAILDGVSMFSVALVSGVANYFFRFWTSTTFQRRWMVRHWMFWILEWLSIFVSFGFFIGGIAVLVSGARNALVG